MAPSWRGYNLGKNIRRKVKKPDEVLLYSLMNDRFGTVVRKRVVLFVIWVCHHPMTAFASNLINGKKRIMLF